MPKNISFALTTPQFLAGTKDVTRRMGWKHLKAGDVLCAVEKSQGIPRGGQVKRLGLIEVVSVRREYLDSITEDDVRREGFPEMSPLEFIAFFCRSHKDCTPETTVTRIEFSRLPDISL